MKYFLYDTETTGLQNKDEVIQFAGYLLDEKFRKLDIVNFYSYTQVPIHKKAYEAHRIDKKLLWKLSGGRTFEEQIFKYDFIRDENDITFIGYNVQFDNRLVNQTLKNNGYDPIDFGIKTNSLSKETGRYNLDLMRILATLLNHNISMKLNVATRKIRSRSITEINKVFDVIFENFGIPSDLPQGLKDDIEISKFHNALYDSFIYWCLLLDYYREINSLFRT